MKKLKLSSILALFLLIGTVMISDPFSKEANAMMFQTVSINCTEPDSGPTSSGTLLGFICKKNGEVYCEWDNYNEPASSSTCFYPE